ncbi:MAG: hypothetical protein U5L96_15960 [Owenweeksia sp.]|nr:hypothetical protein [Owenweeksia sp.]
MKTDGYTKTLLSIIATCLVVLTIHTVGLFPEVRASEPLPPESDGWRFLAVPCNEMAVWHVRLAWR